MGHETGKDAAQKIEEKIEYDMASLEAAKKGLGGDTEIFKVKVRIMAPGLLHNSAEGLIAELDKPTSKAKKKAWKWQEHSYLNKDGIICHPAHHFRASIRDAAKEFQVPGKGRKTYHSLAVAHMHIEPELIPILDPEGRPITEPSSIDERIAVINGPKKVPKPTRRPKFDEGHTLTFLLYSNYGKFPGLVARDSAILAGMQNRIGDYRQMFGKFEIIEFSKLNPGERADVLRAIENP